MTICSKCGCKHDREGQRYCAKCHAAYMRDWRTTHQMNEGQRKRDTARSFANVYKRRGAIVRQPCVVCGFHKSEMHHPNHERPLEVVWLCRPCHLAWHAVWRAVARETFLNWIGDMRAKLIEPAKRSDAA